MAILRGSLVGLLLPLLLFAFPSVSEAHINLDSPVGGEVYVVGDSVTIVWRILITHNLENWDLTYSTDGENGPWNPIVTDLEPGDPSVGSVHTYEWVIPDAVSDHVRVRVHMDNFGEEEDMYDGSPDDFFILEGPIPFPTFIRGDCNSDGGLNLADVLVSLSFQFGDDAAPECPVACDLNDDGQIGLVDAILELAYLFSSGTDPLAPFPSCGWDPTPGPLDCQASSSGCP